MNNSGVIKVDEEFGRINGVESGVFKGRLLAPLPKLEDDDEEEQLRKNHSSVILNMELADDSSRKTVKNFLSGGDAEVLIWEKLWDKHQDSSELLSYDILQCPHHCSWHTLSHDSRSELGDKAKVSPSAKAALSQIRSGGYIVASSCPIKDDDCDPPCHAAKVEYESIADGAKGKFLCTGEHPSEKAPAPLEFTVSEQKLTKLAAAAAAPRVLRAGLIDDISRRAAEAEAVKKAGNSRYA